MVLTDLKLLLRLLAIQKIGIRELARLTGQGSHSYLQRMTAGKVRTCSPELAVAICAVLEVPLDSLFLTKMSTDPQQVSRKPFRGGPSSGRSAKGARPAGRGSRRQAVATVKSA